MRYARLRVLVALYFLALAPIFAEETAAPSAEEPPATATEETTAPPAEEPPATATEETAPDGPPGPPPASTDIVKRPPVPRLPAQHWVYENTTLSDGDFLRGWLVCGPFPNPRTGDVTGDWRHDETCEGFFTDYLAAAGGETAIAPSENLGVDGPDNKTRRWRPVSAHEGRVYLDHFLSPVDGQVAYAACVINATESEDRLFGVGSGDGIRIWVNGEEVFRFHGPREIREDEHYIRLPLQAGNNLILVKTDNGTGRWGFTLRPVENMAAIKDAIPRLRETLRFSVQKSDAAYTVTLGDPLALGNLWDLPEAEIRVIDAGGDTITTFNTPLARPFSLAFSEFPEAVYTLEAKVLWPYRGRVLIPGVLVRADLLPEVRELATALTPNLTVPRMQQTLLAVQADVRQFLDDPLTQRDDFALARLKQGLTEALEFGLAQQKADNPYHYLFPRPAQSGTSGHAPVRITGNWTLHVADSLFDETLDNQFLRRWTERTGALSGSAVGQVHVFALETDFLATPPAELTAPDSPFATLADEFRDSVPPHREGYAIRLDATGVVIAGRTAAGANYGLDTFLQLLEAIPPSEAADLTLERGTIQDSPVHAIRAAQTPLEQFDDAFRAEIDALAALRFNRVFIPSPRYLEFDAPEARTLIQEAFAYCRARFVEPVPLVETFGAQSAAVNLNPDLLEGTLVEELSAVVDDLRRVHLPYDRILLSSPGLPRVRTETGYKILRHDRDYVFKSFAPPILQLKGQAPVQTGETLLITADLVDLTVADTPACCPSDTRTWLLTEKILGNLHEAVQPRAYHLGHGGTGYLNRDSRCLERGMPNDLILADAVQKGTDIVRKFNRQAEVYIWAESINPLDRSAALDVIKAPQQLPRDIIVIDRYPHARTQADLWRAEEGLKYLDQFGFGMLAAVGSDPLAIAHYATMNREHPQRFNGLVHLPTPGQSTGRTLAAQAGWEGLTLLGSIDTVGADANISAR